MNPNFLKIYDKILEYKSGYNDKNSRMYNILRDMVIIDNDDKFVNLEYIDVVDSITNVEVPYNIFNKNNRDALENNKDVDIKILEVEIFEKYGDFKISASYFYNPSNGNVTHNINVRVPIVGEIDFNEYKEEIIKDRPIVKITLSYFKQIENEVNYENQKCY